MGANNSKQSITETQITNEIQIMINNETQNINNILNQTITDTTSNVVIENATKLQISTAGNNNVNVDGDIRATDDGVIDINQLIDIDTINKATAQIVNDVSQISDLSAKIATQLQNKTTNDNSVEGSLAAVASLTKTVTNAGGPEGMLKSVMDTVSKMGEFNNKSKDETKTMIMNKMNIQISNKVLNQNDIKNIIQNHSTSNINQQNLQQCKVNVTAANNVVAKNIIAEGRGKVKISQSAVVKALNECILKAANTTELVNKLVAGAQVATSADTANTNKTTTAMDTKTTLVDTVENKSAIMDTIKSLLSSWMMIPLAICCLLFVCLIIGVAVSFGGSTMSDSDESDMEGGGLITIFNYIKTIPDSIKNYSKKFTK
jgi:hypothetical protein